MKKQKAKNKNVRKIVWLSILSAVLLVLVIFLIWYLTPKKMPRVDVDSVAKIYLFDASSGLETYFTEKEDIEYIVGELHSTKYKAERPAWILGTTFRVYFYDENDKLLDYMILMHGELIYKDQWFWIPNEDLNELYDYFYELLGCTWREND